MRQLVVCLAAALLGAVLVAPVSSAHSSGWWWTVQQANHMTFWWSATHHLDTACTGIGAPLTSPYSEVKATKPAVNGDRQAEQGRPLFHHFRCRSVDRRTGRGLVWILHPTGKYTWVATAAGVPTPGRQPAS